MIRKHRGPAQGGMALVIVMTILAALLAGGAVVLVLQLASTRTATLIKEQRTALYCAEAGLNTARQMLENNVALWDEILATELTGLPGFPSWYPLEGELDDPDGDPDYRVTIEDDADGDHDDPACNDNDATTVDSGQGCDQNSRIFVVSTCLKYSNTPSQVKELIQITGPGGCTYSAQIGGCETGLGQVFMP